MDTDNPKMDRRDVLRATLALKQQEHRDLDDEIAALHEAMRPDILPLQRLKRNKLALKDEIARLEDAITPDIIA